MTRFMHHDTGANPFDENRRPALDKLPKVLADKIRERDRLLAQRSAAQHHANELGTEQAAAAARRSDDEAAAAAARAGKPIPSPVALPKLEDERTKAAHAVQAQTAAFVLVDAECEDVASKLYWSGLEKITAERAAIRSEIAAKASELADAVEAAVDKFAVADWLRGGAYDRTTISWPTEVLDLERYGLTNKNVSPINVRDVIIAAATTCLDEPTNES